MLSHWPMACLAAMARVVVYGASDQGRVTIDLLERHGAHEVVGVIDDTVAPGTELYGYRVLGPGSDIRRLRDEHGFDSAIAAIGDNNVRAQVVARTSSLDPDLCYISVVDPSAVVSRDVVIGVGSVLLAGVIVSGSSTIGEHALMCVGSSLDHDSTLGDFSSMAPGSTTGGRVTIGDHTAIGLGASVIHGVTIGRQTVVGAGSVVVRDVGSFLVAYGSPARPVRARSERDRYL